MKRNAGAILISVIQGIGGVGGPLIASTVLPARQFGLLAIALVVAVGSRSLFALGFYGAVPISIHNREDGTSRGHGLLWWQAKRVVPIACTISAAGLVTTDLAAAVTLSIGFGALGGVALVQQTLFRSTDWIPGYTIAALLPSALAHVGGVTASTIGSPSTKSYLIGMVVASLVGVLILLPQSRHGDKPKAADLSEALHLGAPLIVTALSTAALAMADRPLIQLFVGRVEVGQYFLTYVFAGAAIPLLGGLGAAWLPEVLNADTKSRVSVLAATTRQYGLGFALIGAAAGLAAPAIVSVVAETYVFDGMAEVSALIAASTLPFVLYNAGGIALVGLETTRPIVTATLLGAAVALATNVLLLPIVGLPGAGVATLLSYLVTAIISLRFADMTARHLVAPFTATLWVTACVASFAMPYDSEWALLRIAAALVCGLVGGVAALGLPLDQVPAAAWIKRCARSALPARPRRR